MTESEERDAYLDSVLIGGREAVSIVIRPYDESWPLRFESLRERVERALGATALSVQHVGSTSVPGLAAKPIVDLLLTVEALEQESAYVPVLEWQGFVLRVRESAHRMLRTDDRAGHLHVYEPTDPAVADYLDLRDWLRHSHDDRSLYAATKQALARREWSDLNHYADAKSEVIRGILSRARAWRAERAVQGVSVAVR